MLKILFAKPIMPDISYLIFGDAGWICCFRHAILCSALYDILERISMVSL